MQEIGITWAPSGRSQGRISVISIIWLLENLGGIFMSSNIIGRAFGVRPPKFGKSPCIYQVFFTTFCSKNLCLPTNIFDKSTPVFNIIFFTRPIILWPILLYGVSKQSIRLPSNVCEKAERVVNI